MRFFFFFGPDFFQNAFSPLKNVKIAKKCPFFVKVFLGTWLFETGEKKSVKNISEVKISGYNKPSDCRKYFFERGKKKFQVEKFYQIIFIPVFVFFHRFLNFSKTKSRRGLCFRAGNHLFLSVLKGGFSPSRSAGVIFQLI